MGSFRTRTQPLTIVGAAKKINGAKEENRCSLVPCATSVINDRVMIQYERSDVPSRISRWPTAIPLLLLLYFEALIARCITLRDPFEANGTLHGKRPLLVSLSMTFWIRLGPTGPARRTHLLLIIALFP